MAKQSGIHQIKGKVGEHSYYKQTGVSGGLIRSINQGLSARVKTDEAYANTRLNNQEFGAAGNVASLLGQCVTPKFRPMILPFSQSKMAKEILKVAREHTASWGQRVVTSEDTERLCAILSSMSKRDFNEFANVELSYDAGDNFDAIGTISADKATMLADLGITGVTISVRVFNIATGQWVPAASQMTTGYVQQAAAEYVFDNTPIVSGTELTSTETVPVAEFIPAPNHSGHQIAVFVCMPIRTINSVPHVMQEYCSFTAMVLPVRE